MQIDAEHIASYRRDGIVHLRAAFSPQWVARVTRALDRVLDGRAVETAPSATQDPLVIDRGKTGGTMLLNVTSRSPEIQDWILRSPAAAIVGTISESSTIRFWLDASFMKDGTQREAGTPWHNDYSTWPFWGERLPILWMALTDVGPDDAPLVTLRGSHRDPHRYYSWMSRPDLPSHPMYRPWEELLARTRAPDAQFQAWTLRAGDCLVMHPKLIHSSEPWRRTTPGRRLSFSTRWLGDDAIWNPDPYTFQPAPLAAHPDMRAGAPPPETLFPVLWRRPC